MFTVLKCTWKLFSNNVIENVIENVITEYLVSRKCQTLLLRYHFQEKILQVFSYNLQAFNNLWELFLWTHLCKKYYWLKSFLMNTSQTEVTTIDHVSKYKVIHGKVAGLLKFQLYVQFVPITLFKSRALFAVFSLFVYIKMFPDNWRFLVIIWAKRGLFMQIMLFFAFH